MKMTVRLFVALFFCLPCFVLSPSLTAQEKEGTVSTSELATQVSAQLAAEFKANYESGNAEGISNLFADDGEFIDSQRVVYSGRENIKAEFAALFEGSQERQIELVIDSVRPVASGLILEDGHAWIQSGDDKTTTVSQYISVMVKQGDAWKIASLRDVKSEFASTADRLNSLSWIVGDWIDESEAGITEYTFGWSADGSFLMGSYHIQNKDSDDVKGDIRIGWCPITKQFKSWTFDSDGGVFVGHWNPIPEGWVIKTTGTRSDGVSGSSTNYYEQAGEGKIIWKSFDRHVDGEKQEDVEVMLIRKPPAPGRANVELPESARKE